MSISERIKSLQKELSSSSTQLVAVSKTKPVNLIMEAYDAGQRAFGENKVQELVEKHEALPKDIEWHMIGHLQRNKVKYIAPFIHLIHGIDSVKLLKEVNKQGIKNAREIHCLLQVHIAEETTKFGFDQKEIKTLLSSGELTNLKNVSIQGLMGMATNTSDQRQIAREFSELNGLFLEIKKGYSFSNLKMNHLSMGMSSDYKIALENGSTMVRIGSTIFGVRDYSTL